MEYLPPEESVPNGDSAMPQEDVPEGPPDQEFEFLDEQLAGFLTERNAGKALQYEKKVKSLINAGFQIRVQQPTGLSDAAAFIAFGGPFARAAGKLGAHDETAAKVIDALTVPANPYLMFAYTALPLIAQLVRNHQQQIDQIPTTFRQRRAARKANGPGPKVYLTVPGTRVKIRIPFRVKMGLGFITNQAVDPDALTQGVFSNPKVQKELAKRGIRVGNGQ